MVCRKGIGYDIPWHVALGNIVERGRSVNRKFTEYTRKTNTKSQNWRSPNTYRNAPNIFLMWDNSSVLELEKNEKKEILLKAIHTETSHKCAGKSCYFGQTRQSVFGHTTILSPCVGNLPCYCFRVRTYQLPLFLETTKCTSFSWDNGRRGNVFINPLL